MNPVFPVSVFREYLVQMVDSLVSLLGFRFVYWGFFFFFVPKASWLLCKKLRYTAYVYWYMKMGIIATDVALQIWDDQNGKGLNPWNTGEEKE